MPRKVVLLAVVPASFSLAFALSVAFFEWRHEDPVDYSREFRDMRSQIDVLTSAVNEVRAQAGFTFVDPLPSPPPPATLRLEPGVSARLGTAQVTIDKVLEDRAVFILEGPHPGAFASSFKVVDEDGFVCEAGAIADTGAPLGSGERTHMWILYGCPGPGQVAVVQIESLRFTRD